MSLKTSVCNSLKSHKADFLPFFFQYHLKMSEAPQVDILEASKEKFVNLISELDDSQFHTFEQFVQSALRK